MIKWLWRFFGLSKGEERIADYKSKHDKFRPF